MAMLLMRLSPVTGLVTFIFTAVSRRNPLHLMVMMMVMVMVMLVMVMMMVMLVVTVMVV